RIERPDVLEVSGRCEPVRTCKCDESQLRIDRIIISTAAPSLVIELILEAQLFSTLLDERPVIGRLVVNQPAQDSADEVQTPLRISIWSNGCPSKPAPDSAAHSGENMAAAISSSRVRTRTRSLMRSKATVIRPTGVSPTRYGPCQRKCLA